MHQESQKISVPYNGILPINIKQVPQYSPIPVSDTLVECHVWNHWTRSSVPTATTIPWNVGELIVGRSEPVWSLTASVCLPTTPMIKHGKWKFGTVVPATQTRDQVFYFQWIIQCSQSSDFFSVIITPAFLIFFFQSKLPEEIKQGKCHLELHLHMKHFPKYKARWSKSEL